MKIAALSYSYSRDSYANIGDWFQTLAVEQHLPRVDFYIDRDQLSEYDGEQCILVMNGWFSHRPKAWPPSNKIIPIFHGFHMTDEAAKHYRDHVNYFKKYEPIGCRDRGTMEIMESWGIDSYLSLCCTLTFPQRESGAYGDITVLTDLPRYVRGPSKHEKPIRVKHEIPAIDPLSQRGYAIALLDFYRSRARELATSRIHAAMPCIAMGIPTVFVGNKFDRRNNILKDIGIPDRHIINSRDWRNWKRLLSLSPSDFFSGPLNIKSEIEERLRERLSEYVELNQPKPRAGEKTNPSATAETQ